MELEILKSEKKLCVCCMAEHEVKTVALEDTSIFKDVEVSFEALYEYCDIADEYVANEGQLRQNFLNMKDSYRKKLGLLTSLDILHLREKYGISQTDLSRLLGWGAKTLTRYETCQVQDKAHDSILKKLNDDPEWFLSLLEDSRNSLSKENYNKYLQKAMVLYENKQNDYLKKSIEATYAKYKDEDALRGNTSLSLSKVVEVIRYLASSKEITNLYKVKLMKMLWYADSLSYKKYGHAITGLVYKALPMGAVPVCHNEIINLKGVPCEEVDFGETIAYHFVLEKEDRGTLSNEEIEILNTVIQRFGKMSKQEIVDCMHKELAYKKTLPREPISYDYTKYIQLGVL